MRDASARTLLESIESMELTQAKGFADFLRHGERRKPLPCWGAIVERFERDFSKDSDRITLLDVLLEVGNRRALTLFLYRNLMRPAVIEKMFSKAQRLPVAIQRFLVAMTDPAHLQDLSLENVAPAARQLLEMGEEAREREEEMFLARVAKLLSYQYFVPPGPIDDLLPSRPTIESTERSETWTPPRLPHLPRS